MIWVKSRVDSKLLLRDRPVNIFRNFFFLVLVVPILLIPGRTDAVQLDQVVAIVNDEAVTRLEYETRHRRRQLETRDEVLPIPEQVDPAVLELLIEEKLKIQTARRVGLDVSAEEVENTLAVMAEQSNHTVDGLLEALDQQGISPLQLRKSIAGQILINRVTDALVNSRVEISDEEIEYHLQAHPDLYATDVTYEISHLFVSTEGKTEEEIQTTREMVDNLLQKLHSGLSFEQAVTEYSEGEEKETGGYIGWQRENQLPDLFLEILRETGIGDISEPVESARGIHIFKLHSKGGDVKIVAQQRVRHILVEPNQRNLTEEEILELLDSLKTRIGEGEEFAQLARLNSDDKTSAVNGGSLGWTNPGEMAAAMEEMANSLPINQVSEPFRSQFGYHIIEVLERRNRDISRSLIRKKAEREVFKRKANELYQNWLGRMRENAYIEY